MVLLTAGSLVWEGLRALLMSTSPICACERHVCAGDDRRTAIDEGQCALPTLAVREGRAECGLRHGAGEVASYMYAERCKGRTADCVEV